MAGEDSQPADSGGTQNAPAPQLGVPC